MTALDHHASSRVALYNVEATRRLERAAQEALPPHTLMRRAGLAVAQLTLALAPHARRIWIACGPGNNGGDGLEAAMHLQRWGKKPLVTWLGRPDKCPADAAASFIRARDAGVPFLQEPPEDWDFCVDALLGIGSTMRAPSGPMAAWIGRINAGTAEVLSIDLPTGLDADTGVLSSPSVKARYSLSLLTLKPGLFIASGRDAAGSVWLHKLGLEPTTDPTLQVVEPSAWLAAASKPMARPHASHKGSYGDVAVIGGAVGMTGAAVLAASAALHAGAGRVFVGLLDHCSMALDSTQPELMFRAPESLDYSSMTVVCGCGGGHAIADLLPTILLANAHVVIDADAINEIAKNQHLQDLLCARAAHATATILTPHPLEAARLLGGTVAHVQQDRIAAACQLAQRFGCTVVLKGSGTVVASPGQPPVINPTGNARLATAGTGDVLAGMIGAALARGTPALEAACIAVYQHGWHADHWPAGQPLTASALGRFGMG